jgi:formate hydrogenlyase subunit 4
MLSPLGIIQIVLALLFAPLVPGIINRTKAAVAGRRGQPWLQTYHELWKLLHKGAVYSRTATVLFVLGPIVGCAATGLVLPFIPLGGSPALVSFPGDFLLVAYLLGVARFFTVTAALDTGSSFEGMGASREVFFSALTEPALLLAMTTLAAAFRALSLTDIYAGIEAGVLASGQGPVVLLVAAAMFVAFLAENARIPVDDPNTHLELTMIHEVMVLDHSGPDFAMIQYGACLKMWVLGALLMGVLAPVRTGWLIADLGLGLGGLALLAVLTGMVESLMARLRLVRVPQFLIAASVLSIVALVLVMS